MSWVPVSDSQVPNWANINDSQDTRWSSALVGRLLQQTSNPLLQQNGYYIILESNTPTPEDWQNIVT